MPHEQQPGPAPVSRRKLILTGATLAAAGVVVGAAAAVPLSAAVDGTPESPSENPKEPVMVHLRDARTGQFDVFVGDRRIQLDDRAFAARLASAVTAS